MIKYDEYGKLEAKLLNEDGVLSKKRIKQENYKMYKKDFHELIELMTMNKMFHSLYAEQLDFYIDKNLEFKVISESKLHSYSYAEGLNDLTEEDTTVITMDKHAYEQFHELCIQLIIKVKKSWKQLNEVERFILKSLEFDNPPKVDDDVSFELSYDPKKYYQFKKSGYIKMGVQLKVHEATKSNSILPKAYNKLKEENKKEKNS